MNIDLTGKRAVVCGSSRGIGRAVAEVLARLNASVTLVARDEDALRQVCDGLAREAGQQHDFMAVDFSVVADLRHKIHEYAQNRPPTHILVNNTGGPPAGPVLDAGTEAFVTAFSNHLICNHILAGALIPGMRTEKYGRIINIVSTSVKAPLPGLGVSNTVRGAVASWAKSLANEVGAFGVTVNNVLPGATQTGRLEALIEGRAKQAGQSVRQVTEAMIGQIPLQRFAQPEEIAYAVAFLASPAGAYINGVNLPVDGGRTGCL